MSLLSYFRREPPLYQTDNLFNYIKAYPSRVADEAREALQGISDPITRMSSAAQLITSPIAPASEDLFSQLGQFTAPGINRHQQAMIDAQNQLAERLNLPTQDYTPMSGEQVGEQLAMLGSLMRGKFPNWVSPSQIAIRGFQPKATGQQYAKALEKEKGAITEARETGLLKALQETPGTITQEQALSLVSPLELTETIKGVTEVPSNPTLLDAKTFFGITDEDWNKMTPYQQQSYVDEIREGGRHIQRSDDTKYGRDENLNLPGGTNEKEILVQLPTVKDTAPPYSQWLESKGYSDSDRRAHFGEYQREYPPKDVTDFTKGHWDEPNVLVHIRTNERDVGGKKALHLEEIQSDWHQQGRDMGYGKPTLSQAKDYYAITDDDWANMTPHQQQSYVDEIVESGKWKGIPDAPFKQNWHELGWKRHFMEALRDPSIERLTWTTGDVQADRYNLAKYINAIDARPNPNGTFQLAVRHKDGGTKNLTNVKVDELSDYVGKEMADKIVEEATGVTKSYQGLDLEIGGEFHKNLYDKKIPQFAKKFLKDFGVEPQRISSATEFDEVYGADGERYFIQRDLVDGQFDIIQGRRDDENSHQWMRTFSNYEDAIEGLGDFGGVKDDLWYIDITPEMREHFINQGIKMTMAPNQMGLLPEQEMRLLA